MWEYNYTNYDELYHFGIKGMKWGVRRFQNKNGSLTSAGKKRYADSEEGQKLKANIKKAKADYKKAQSEYNKISAKTSFLPTDENAKKLNKSIEDLLDADRAKRRAKLDYNTGKEAARIRDKNVTFENKSKHRLKLEQKYKELGMTDEQAQAAANNRIRTEKILAATAAVTVTAAAAYAFNKKRKEGIDGVIKAGEKLQRIEMTDTDGKLHDVFYTSKGDHDNKRYAGLLGFTRQQQTGHAYMMELAAKNDVKVASKNKAVEVFGELYKNDKEFANAVAPHITTHFNGQSNKIRVGALSHPTDKDLKKMYENFNSAIVDLNMSNNKSASKFYDTLKKQGYGAIQDINDMKYSGFAAKNPLIVFDGANDNIMVKSVTEMTKQGAGAKYGIELGKAMVEQTINQYSGLLAGGVAARAAITYASDDTKQYKDPRKEKK